MSIQKPGGLIDRDQEWAQLRRMWDSGSPELFVVRGRRRAGKSFLLGHFVEATNGFYHQATRRTEREQLLSLSRALAQRFDDATLRRVRFDQWEDLFHYCMERAGDAPFVFVLDEFPYLVDAAPALPSILQSIWDHDVPGTQFKIVLSGSHITAMKRLTQADQPLYGRRTGLLQVNPLSYLHAGAFVPNYSAADKILAYGMFGGLPGHLTLLDPSASLVENVVRRILDPTARLYEEATHALDAFVSDAGVHYSIIEAIASGEVQWQKISSRIGKKSASLSRPLDWLKEMEVVEQVAPITEYPDPSPKSMVYRLLDPYLHFWHRFVAEVRAQGIPFVLEPDEVWRAYVEPRIDDYVGKYVLENVCRQFVAHSRHPRLPFRPARVGSWWTQDFQEEIDVVALGVDGEVLLAECKWGAVSRTDLQKLRRRAELILPQLRGVRSVHLAIFAGGDVDTRVEAEAESGDLLLFSLDDLFAGAG